MTNLRTGQQPVMFDAAIARREDSLFVRAAEIEIATMQDQFICERR